MEFTQQQKELLTQVFHSNSPEKQLLFHTEGIQIETQAIPFFVPLKIRKKKRVSPLARTGYYFNDTPFPHRIIAFYLKAEFVLFYEKIKLYKEKQDNF